MNPDGSTATSDKPADAPEDTPKYSNPNDLEFEMTPEQEADYVEQILANGDYTPPASDKPADAGDPEALPKENTLPENPKDSETPPAPEDPKDAPSEATTPQSDDLWIEVEQTVVDDLGEETTKTVKLTYDPSDPGSFIPDDFTTSTKQLAEIMRAEREMSDIYKGRVADFDKEQATKASAQRDKDILAGWDSEIADLIKSGVLEAPKLKIGDKGYGEDPSVARTDAIFKFMAEKNEERAKEGVSPIQSFSLAFTMFENDAAKKAEEETRKKEDEETKQRGALIGGGSAASGGTAEQTAYRAGSHKSIWDVPVEE